MKIIFVFEDTPGGIDIKCLRMDVGHTTDTPANAIAKHLEHQINDLTDMAQQMAKEVRAARCWN